LAELLHADRRPRQGPSRFDAIVMGFLQGHLPGWNRISLVERTHERGPATGYIFRCQSKPIGLNPGWDIFKEDRSSWGLEVWGAHSWFDRGW